ncbi:MAG: lipoyl(octanoyl) transferase LipB [Thermodesulfobacteriota bacterium]
MPNPAQPARLVVAKMPLTEYSRALDIQQGLVQEKIRGFPDDVLLVLEHPDTITLGTRGEVSDLLTSQEELAHRKIALHRVDRGGRATYHGPGQVVCYPIVDLRWMALSARTYVENLEEVIIRTLGLFGVVGCRRQGAPGVWTSPREKVASIGVKIRRRITSHGFSLNVNVDRGAARWIVSCGMPDIVQVNLADIAPNPVLTTDVAAVIPAVFAEVFQPSAVEFIEPHELPGLPHS